MVGLLNTEFWADAYATSLVFERGVDGAMGLRYRDIHAPRLPAPTAFSAQDLLEYVGEYFSPELETSYSVELTNDALVLRQLRHGAESAVVAAAKQHGIRSAV